LSKSLTEHALATIASILDHSESTRRTQKPLPEEKSLPEEKTATLVPADADGYFKLGPGPMEAIRFKWVVRRAENGDYFVEETIGENSPPIVSGPMPKEEAVRFVDERESEARQRFEQLRHEMAGRAAVTDVIGRSGEV
jgi:hypothetical protein